MRKSILLFLITCTLFFGSVNFSEAATKNWGATALTGGGTGALDKIDGALLTDLDAAFVNIFGTSYLYTLDADASGVESSPSIINPDTNPGTKSWLLQSLGCNNIVLEGASLFMKEQSAAQADIIAYGQFWVKDDTPNTPQFTDDGGFDFQLATLTDLLSIEGTSILSTGEAGGTKFLREDGDGTCSWQAVPSGLGSNLTSTTNDILSDTGVIVLGGTGNTNNENLTLDFETTANECIVNGSFVTIRLTNQELQLSDVRELVFGTGAGDVKTGWQNTGNDNFQIAIKTGLASGSGYFSIVELSDLNNANRSPLAISVDPVLRIYSSDETSALDYLEFFHDQVDANIQWGTGNLNLPLSGAAGVRTDKVVISGMHGASGHPLLLIDQLSSSTSRPLIQADVLGSTKFSVDNEGDMVVGQSIGIGANTVFFTDTAKTYITVNSNNGMFLGTFAAIPKRGSVSIGDGATFPWSGATPVSANQDMDNLLIRRDWDLTSTFTEAGALLRLERDVVNATSQNGNFLEWSDDTLGELGVIDKNGNLGVGTSTPSTKLHVDSNAADTVAILTVENTGGDFQVFRDDASPESVITGSPGDLCIDSTGGDAYIKKTGAASNTGWLRLNTNGLVLQTISSSINPADSTTYFTGGLPIAISTSAGIQKISIPKTGTVTAIYVTILNATVQGTTETSTMSFRLNDTSDTTISAVIQNDLLVETFSNTGLSIAVSGGDFFEIKWVTPAWVTNPQGVFVSASVYIE